MTLQLDLQPEMERELETLAQSEGISIGEYAMRRLFPTYAANSQKKPLSLDRYIKSADRQKTAAEIDATIAENDAERDSWELRERSWVQPVSDKP